MRAQTLWVNRRRYGVGLAEKQGGIIRRSLEMIVTF